MEKFTPDLLRQPTAKTLLFIAKAENTPILFKSEKYTRSITTDFAHDQLVHWKSGKFWVFIWSERIHDKKGPLGEKVYFNHYMYQYYLVPAGHKITVKPSESQFDFGFHRVKDSLAAEGAIHLLTVNDEDLTGHQNV